MEQFVSTSVKVPKIRKIPIDVLTLDIEILIRESQPKDVRGKLSTFPVLLFTRFTQSLFTNSTAEGRVRARRRA